MEENMENIAKHFLVLKAIGCHPDVSCSMVIARESCCTINPLRLRRLNDATINNLNVYNVGIASVTGDGASENITFNEISCTVRLGDFITTNTRSLFEKYHLKEYLDYKAAKIDPYTGDLIFFMEDMPHVVKRLVNALYDSSKESTTRNLHHGDHCMNLRMIEQVWEKTGGTSQGVHTTHLTGAHFDKDNFSKMRVYLCVQVVSGSVLRMFESAFDDPITTAQLPFQKDEYAPLLHFITHVNNFVDILNGRGGKHFTPTEGLPIIESLLKIFEWFDRWKKLNESSNLSEKNFLAKQTWEGLERIICCYVGKL